MVCATVGLLGVFALREWHVSKDRFIGFAGRPGFVVDGVTGDVWFLDHDGVKFIKAKIAGAGENPYRKMLEGLNEPGK
jgi:hypothetical protein